MVIPVCTGVGTAMGVDGTCVVVVMVDVNVIVLVVVGPTPTQTWYPTQRFSQAVPTALSLALVYV